MTPRGVTSVVAKLVTLAAGHSAEVGLNFQYDLSLSTTNGVFLIINFYNYLAKYFKHKNSLEE